MLFVAELFKVAHYLIRIAVVSYLVCHCTFLWLESSFCRCLNSLYDPAVKSALFPAYTAALDMHDLDTSAIYGENNQMPRSKLFKWKNSKHTGLFGVVTSHIQDLQATDDTEDEFVSICQGTALNAVESYDPPSVWFYKNVHCVKGNFMTKTAQEEQLEEPCLNIKLNDNTN